MRCMRGYIPASRVQFKSLGGGGGPLLVSSAILRDRTESQGGLRSPVPHEALVWYWRGYTGSQGVVEVSRW